MESNKEARKGIRTKAGQEMADKRFNSIAIKRTRTVMVN